MSWALIIFAVAVTFVVLAAVSQGGNLEGTCCPHQDWDEAFAELVDAEGGAR